MHSSRLWLAWSWRDLRRRWTVVVAISLVIALGTGTYAALLSTSAWRRQSNDVSFSQLHVHDLRVSLAQGTTVAEGTIAGLLRSIPDYAALDGVRERLVAPTQVAGPSGLLVPGELVGTAVSGGPVVDGVSAEVGRGVSAADGAAPVVVLDRGFAKTNRLGPQGNLVLSGGVPVRYVGQGQSPEYFLVSGSQGTLPFLTQKSYAVLYATLHSAQALTSSPGLVNDAVVTLRPGADREAVRREIVQAFVGARPPMAALVTTRDDIDAYRVLYRDIGNDEQLWRIVAFLILGGAAFAALNLTSRLVESQRREIGIGMALGVPDRLLALRPLLFGAEVALIGVAFGVGVGFAVSQPLRTMFSDLVPLPVWKTPFQPGVFAQAAALGFVLPLVAVAWPVWRAMRVEPAEAIRVGSLTARSAGLATVMRAVPNLGRGYRQMPLRNVLRTPRRTLLTAIGVAAAITTLVTTMGFLNTFNTTLDRAQSELLHAAPGRVTVALRTFTASDGTLVQAVGRLPEVGSVSPGLMVGTTASHDGRSLDLLTEVIAPGGPWSPTITSGAPSGGIVLAAKAASDLRVAVGDVVMVGHPEASSGGMRTVTSPVRVAGIHPNPMRALSYVDPNTARMFGLAAAANVLTIVPAGGVTSDAVRRALLAVPGVASAESARAVTEGMRTSLDQYLGILRVAAAITLLLALLIAFNTASIGMDERRRENATMLAFGLPLRSLLGLGVAEAVLLGVLGTAIGIAGGYGVLRWMVTVTVPRVMPELGVSAALTAGTLLTTALLGVGVVAAAPLLTGRRLRRLDVPSALRLVE